MLLEVAPDTDLGYLFMNNKRYYLFILVLFIAISVNAQFASSENAYYYEYQYTIQDGIKSQSQHENYFIYIFNFQNNMLGWTCGSKKDIKQKLINDSEFYARAARNNLGESYRRWNTKPQTITDVSFPPGIFMYNPNTSTSSKYTYQLANRTSSGGLGYGWQWTGYNWGRRCFSFSTDRQELIEWYTDNDMRFYYKKIDKNSLKRNLDFLY